MPSTSEKQARTMRAAAHDPKFANKVGIPKSVAEDFVAADAKKSLARPQTATKADRDGLHDLKDSKFSRAKSNQYKLK